MHGRKIQMEIESIKAQVKEKQTVLFGCGNLGKKAYKYFSKNKISIKAVVDNDKRKWGGKFCGKKIENPVAVIEKFTDAYFLIANVNHAKDIQKQLIGLGISKDKIFIVEEANLDFAVILQGRYLIENKHFIFDRPMPISMKGFIEYIGFSVLDIYHRCRMNIFCPKTEQSKKYRVAICAMFKNEGFYLKEWIEFHKIVGIEHFYLYNNFSDDNYLEILQPYIISNLVTLIDWPVPQGQIPAYTDCFEKYSGESQWIGMIDIDEFIVPVKYENIYTFLKPFEKKRGSVLIYWKNFGTNGFITRDYRKNLVIEDFTVCWRKHVNIGKCFINTNFTPAISKQYLVHHEAWTSRNGKIFPPVNCDDHIAIFNKYNIIKSQVMPIQINHYLVKSLEEFEMKNSKGDSFFKNHSGKQKYLTYEKHNTSVDYNAYKFLMQLKQNIHQNY
jgi:hypothetical protein